MEVKDGGPVDVLLLDSKNYLDFEEFFRGRRSSFKYFKTGSALNIMSKSYSFTIPYTDRWFIVICNEDLISGGAEPRGDVSVFIKVTVTI